MIERGPTQYEIALSELLGINSSYASSIKISDQVRASVCELYSSKERAEIEQIVTIHPDGAKLLSVAQTIEEFNQRMREIYQVVLVGQISFEDRAHPPVDTKKWEWKTQRCFGWEGNDVALDVGFPVKHIQETYPSGSTVTASSHSRYASPQLKTVSGVTFN